MQKGFQTCTVENSNECFLSKSQFTSSLEGTLFHRISDNHAIVSLTQALGTQFDLSKAQSNPSAWLNSILHTQLGPHVSSEDLHGIMEFTEIIEKNASEISKALEKNLNRSLFPALSQDGQPASEVTAMTPATATERNTAALSLESIVNLDEPSLFERISTRSSLTTQKWAP
jgi:hypothetical protein